MGYLLSQWVMVCVYGVCILFFGDHCLISSVPLLSLMIVHLQVSLGKGVVQKTGPSGTLSEFCRLA
jgi:hypothetical protein